MIEPHPGLLEITTDEPDDVLIQIVREVYNSTGASSKLWHIEQSSDPLKQWLRFHADEALLPQQGWKLHVSASVSSAQTVLRNVLPLLLTRAVAFKLAASLKRLRFLNQGRAGRSQIGKFITIYPQSNDEAVELAILLDAATSGLEGPTIPSDHPLRPGSLVYYRYGGFSSQLIVQNSIGLIVPAISTPDHEVEPDQRHVPYQAPSWAIDPFIGAGIAVEPPAFKRLIGNRYLIVAIIATSMNSTIYLGSDLEAARTCVIKGPGFAHANNSDKATRARVEHEAHILDQLAGNNHFPALFDVLEEHGSLYLVMEDIEGETLDIYASKRIARGQHLSLLQVIAWGQELAGMLNTIHARGLVYTDLKPSNVIVGVDGLLHLIDFELTHTQGDSDAKWKGCGTEGYMSPQQKSGEPVTARDDIYSFGAFLYSLVTGAEPSYAPNYLALLDRPIERLNPTVGTALRDIIVRCLDPQPQARYDSMSDLNAALEHAKENALVVPLSFGDEWNHSSQLEATAHYRMLARRLLDTLCSVAYQPKNSEGLVWKSAHYISYGLMARDVNTGNGGTLLALAELASELADTRGKQVLEAGAHWLSTSHTENYKPLPGLYVGEAGVGAALLRVGQVLQKNALIERAEEQGRLIAALPYGSPDLFNGTAGRLRFHLLLWDETGEREHLQAASKCAEHLLAMAKVHAPGEYTWTIPAGFDSLSGQTYMGYAHGAAGIADTLLDLFEITGDERLLPAIQGVGSWLKRLAVPTLDDESGLNWSRIEGWPVTSAFWCHGATGIGQFFLHAATADVFPEAMDYAARAARMVARGTRGAGPTQCHGLPGNIEFLLDMYQATTNDAYLSEALSLASLLEAFARENEGHLVFSSELPDIFTPDYMVGYAGVAMALLRLSLPERLPHQLSRSGFRHQKQDR